MSRFSGNLDSVSSNGVVSGWVVDGEHPAAPAEITALLDGEPVATFVCTGSRPDVRAAGFGTMVAGFSFSIPERYCDGKERHLSFRPASGGDSFSIGGPATITLAPKPAGDVVLDRETAVLKGWVADPRNSHRPILIEMLVDGAPIKVIPLRPDPKREDKDRATFEIPLPPEVIGDRNSRRIELRLLESGRHLGGPIASRASRLQGNFEILRGRHISGWAYDVGLSIAPKLDVYCDGKHMSQVSCDGFRKDLFDYNGATAGWFNAVVPIEALDPEPKFVQVRFDDGSELNGGPKRIEQVDLDLARLEASVVGGPGVSEIPTIQPKPQLGVQLTLLGRLLSATVSKPEYKMHRLDAVELGQELLVQTVFSSDAATAFEVARSLSMLGINVCSDSDDFLRLLAVLNDIGDETPDLYGLLELERQRRRPLYRLLSAAIMLSNERAEEGIDLIFESFYGANESEKVMIASLGIALLIRTGHAANAESLMIVSLSK